MKRWLTVIGSLLCVGCAYFFISRLSAQWSMIQQLRIDTVLLCALALATVLYLATYITGASSWCLSLRVVGAKLSLAEATRISSISQIGKYLPGNVGQHVGRVVLAGRAGLATPAVIASLFLDMAAVVVAGTLTSILMLDVIASVFQRFFPLTGVQLAITCFVGFGLAAALLLLILRLPNVRSIFLPRARQALQTWRQAANRWRMTAAVACHGASFIAGGIGMTLIASAISPTTVHWTMFPTMLGAYAASWLCGFLIPGAPAGLGIRETVLMLCLSTTLDGAQATTLTLVLRVMTTLGDAIAFLLGLGWAGLSAKLGAKDRNTAR